ncbi:MAG: NifB/NifX family molybdenum-iron cluster-binding protein [Myxococcota bacterium]
MKVCIPVNEDQALQSTVCPHFGSAPIFMIVDTDTKDCRAIPNANAHHAHGMCMPLNALQGEHVDAMVVGGIGMGALNKLNAAGVKVYLAERPTVGETIDALAAGSLQQMQPGMTCGGHRGGGC